MKIVAIVAEYNPFHKGHKYQIDYVRQKLGADVIVIAMSGNYAQRGLPCVVDKFARAKMALENGADIVFEIPTYFALGSAEYYAKGAVSMLDKLGVVDELCFGSECGDISALTSTATLLYHEPPEFKASLDKYLKLGHAYPIARTKALSEVMTAEDTNPTKEIDTIHNILSDNSPNNNLGVEYIKALLLRKSSIKPTTLTRMGSYNETSLQATDSSFASASAIRRALSGASAHEDIVDLLSDSIPTNVMDFLSTPENQLFLYENDFSGIVAYKLMSELSLKSDLSQYFDVTRQLSDVFKKNISGFTTFNDFCLACKSKNISYTRISRCLFHILLDMKQEDVDYYKYNDYTSYARLLGFSDMGRTALKLIKANSSIPVINKPVDTLKKADKLVSLSLEKDIYASQLYYQVQGIKYQRKPKNELTCQLIN